MGAVGAVGAVGAGGAGGRVGAAIEHYYLFERSFFSCWSKGKHVGGEGGGYGSVGGGGGGCSGGVGGERGEGAVRVLGRVGGVGGGRWRWGRWVCWRRGRHVGSGCGGNVVVGGEGEGAESNRTRRSPPNADPGGSADI